MMPEVCSAADREAGRDSVGARGAEPKTASRPGHLLNGRVYHEQPAALYRTGIEPVILAASVPARSGQTVLEFGCGAGAALLCLAARVPGITGFGVEIQNELAALAHQNIDANRLSGQLHILAGDALTATPPTPVDHAFANPPWHDEKSSRSLLAGRDIARRAGKGQLLDWAGAMSKRLRHRGTLTMILPSNSVNLAMAAFAASGCGSITLFPLWPRAGRPARIVVLQGIYLAKGPCRILPGLVLHDPDGRFTKEATEILRGGGALELGLNQQKQSL